MGMKRYARHSAYITGTKRWKRLRYEALRRDGFACVQCGARGRLEVDHREPVRDAPDRAYDLTNLQVLCVSCHARKTRAEIGMGEPDPARVAWKTLVRETGRNPIEHERKPDA